MSRQLSLRDLSIRLSTVARTVGEEPAYIPLFICIAGDRMSLMTDTFQVDDDGTLLVQVPQLKKMEELLRRSDERYGQAMLQLHHITETSNRLSQEVAVACEAYLACDTVTALHKLGQLAETYKRNLMHVVTPPSEEQTHG